MFKLFHRLFFDIKHVFYQLPEHLKVEITLRYIYAELQENQKMGLLYFSRAIFIHCRNTLKNCHFNSTRTLIL